MNDNKRARTCNNKTAVAELSPKFLVHDDLDSKGQTVNSLVSVLAIHNAIFTFETHPAFSATNSNGGMGATSKAAQNICFYVNPMVN